MDIQKIIKIMAWAGGDFRDVTFSARDEKLVIELSFEDTPPKDAIALLPDIMNETVGDGDHDWINELKELMWREFKRSVVNSTDINDVYHFMVEMQESLPTEVSAIVTALERLKNGGRPAKSIFTLRKDSKNEIRRSDQGIGFEPR